MNRFSLGFVFATALISGKSFADETTLQSPMYQMPQGTVLTVQTRIDIPANEENIFMKDENAGSSCRMDMYQVSGSARTIEPGTTYKVTYVSRGQSYVQVDSQHIDRIVCMSLVEGELISIEGFGAAMDFTVQLPEPTPVHD